jgi:proline iminopeptidase
VSPATLLTRRNLLVATAGALALTVAVQRCATDPLSAGGSLVNVNGNLQWLMMAGRPDATAQLLILHGGPGGSETVLFRHFNRALESHFRVAYWDQRGAGHSYDPKSPPSGMTVDQFTRDMTVIITHLRNVSTLPIVLVGHSWGAALGLIYAHRYPQTVAGYIGVSPAVSMPKQLSASYHFARTEAQRLENAKASRELEDIGPPPFDVAALAVKDRWVETFGGSFAPGFHKTRVALEALIRGETSIGEVRQLIAANRFSLEAMWPEVQALDVAELVPSIQIPVAFLLGRHDRQAPPEIIADYLERFKAPDKSTLWFERSAHNIPFEQPAAFNSAVSKLVDRWTVTRA